MEFKIGDRVVCDGEVDGCYSTRGERGMVIGDINSTRGERGMVIGDINNAAILIQFDNLIPNAHGGSGRGKYGHCLWVHPDMLKLETAVTPIIPASEREYITL